MPPADRPDVLRTASGPGIGLGLRRCGAQLDPTSVVSATAGVWSSAYVICQYGCGLLGEASAGRLPPRPSRWPRGQGSSPPRCAWPAAFLFCPVGLAGAEIPASGCRDRVRGNPVPYPISYAAGSGSGADPAPPNVRSRKPTVSQPAPLCLTTSSYPCAVQAARAERRRPGAPAEFAASPRRDERCGQAARTGRYECRHHSRPTVVAGVNSAICELAISQGHLTLVTLSYLGAVLSEFSVVLSLLPRMLIGDGLSVDLAGAAFGAGRCGLGRSESKPLIKGPAPRSQRRPGGQPRTSPVPPCRGRTRTGASPPSQGRGRPLPAREFGDHEPAHVIGRRAWR